MKFKEQLTVLANLEEVFFVDMVKRDDAIVVIAGTTYLNETDLSDIELWDISPTELILLGSERGGYYRYTRNSGSIRETVYKLGSFNNELQHPVCQANPFSIIW